jgi:hypothetical protein
LKYGRVSSKGQAFFAPLPISAHSLCQKQHSVVFGCLRNPLQIRTQNRIQEIVPNLRFLLLFRDNFTLLSVNFKVRDKKNLSFGGVCASGGWALFAFIKIMGYY